jgi:hypothetical protein
MRWRARRSWRARRAPADRERLDLLTQFWDAVDRTSALAAEGRDDAARAQVSLSPRPQAALSTAVARLLIENNEIEEQAAQRVQGIYDQVQRQVYWFLTATLIAIGRPVYLIRATGGSSPSRVAPTAGERAATDRHPRIDVASPSREHDEVADSDRHRSMPGASKQTSRTAAACRPARDRRWLRMLNVRSLSQTLHPSTSRNWGRQVARLALARSRSNRLVWSYERTGTTVPVDGTVGIHAIASCRRRSAMSRAIRGRPRGVPTPATGPSPKRRIMVAVWRPDRRRGSAWSLCASVLSRWRMIEFTRPAEGGTIVRLRVPLEEPDDQEKL